MIIPFSWSDALALVLSVNVGWISIGVSCSADEMSCLMVNGSWIFFLSSRVGISFFIVMFRNMLVSGLSLIIFILVYFLY